MGSTGLKDTETETLLASAPDLSMWVVAGTSQELRIIRANKNTMTKIQGIELSEDEVLMAQEMGLEDFLYEDEE